MKKMNNLIALAVATAVMSPMAAMADHMPDNVGDVTLLGNIVANSPMWQWTVNDYPGPRLDAKPSEATTANGVTTYKLAGQPFIAVSGYIPSMAGMPNSGTMSTAMGTRDITEFQDGNGRAIGDIQALAEPQAMSFTIGAVSTDASGKQAIGKLKLKATEVRGFRRALSFDTLQNYKDLFVATSAITRTPTTGGSCFVGNSAPALTLSGDTSNFNITNGSAAANNAFIQGLQSADAQGAVKWGDIGNTVRDRIQTWDARCTDASTYTSTLGDVSTTKLLYISAAHVVELTPIEVAFTTPVGGAWNATLNVTAYQM